MNKLVLLVFLIAACAAKGQLDIVLQTGNKGNVLKTQIHPSKNLFLSLDTENNVVVWDLQLRKQFAAQHFQSTIADVCFIDEDTYAVAIQNRIEYWDFSKGELEETIETKSKVEQLQNVDNKLRFLAGSIYEVRSPDHSPKALLQEGGVFGFNYSEDGKYLALSKKKLIEVRKGHEEPLFSLKSNSKYLHLSAQHNYFASCTDNASLVTYNLSEKQKDGFLTNTRSWNEYVAVDFYEQYGVTGDNQDIITVFELKNGRIIKQFKNRSGAIHSLDLDAKKNILLVGGEGGVIQYYDLSSQHRESTFQSISPTVSSIQFVSDDQLLLGYENGSIKWWDLKNHIVKTLKVKQKKLDDIKQAKYKVDITSDSTALITKNYHSFLNKNNNKTDYLRANFSFKTDELELAKEKSNIRSFRQFEGLKEKSESSKFNYTTSQTGKEIQLEAGKQFVCSASSPDKSSILASCTDGFLYLIDSNSGEILLKMCSPSPSGFFYLDEANYYFASKDALKYLGARYKNELIGFEQIDLVYNRPDKVLSNFSFVEEEYIGLLKKAYEKRMQKLNLSETNVSDLTDLPEVRTNLNKIPLQTKQRDWKIRINASTKEQALKSLHVLINGVPLNGKRGFELNNRQAEHELTVSLSSGKNKIQVYVENDLGLKSIREEVTTTLNLSTTKDLHLLTIGSGEFQEETFNLNYAGKDAEDVRLAFAENDQFEQIHNYNLTGKDVSKKKVFEAIEKLKAANIDDVIIVFFAGHGVLDPKLDYYLSAYDMNFSDPSENGILFDELEVKLGQLKCRHKILLIDACHSGELDKEEATLTEVETSSNEDLLEFRSGTSSIGLVGGKSIFELSKNLFVDLRTNNGVVIISSAGAAEYALEGADWKNGAFTYCILEGLNNEKADLNKNKEVTLNELQQYLFEAVPELTNGKQTPTSRVEILEQDYVIW